MAADVETRKRKRLAKNKKRSWRKTDIDDVEEHLEDIRLQERTGGIAAEKEDHELFFVDTSTVAPDEPPVKRKREAKPLKCHALLEPDPNTKPGRAKQNVKQDSITKRCTAIQEKSKLGLKSKTEKKAAEQRSRATSQRETRSKTSKKLYTAEYDLWSASVPDPSVDEFYLKQTKQTRKRPPSWYHEKTSEYKAIEVPHPGTSYNPTFEDHQELLAKAVDVETEKEKQAMKIKRALDDVFAKGGNVPVEQRWMEEMSVGLKDDEGDDSQNREEEEAADDLGLSCNPPVRREDKKTEKQRRKERERKELEEKLSKSKGEKQRKNDIFRLKNIKKAVKERQVAVAESKKKKATRRDESKGKTKKLGKMKYEEPELDLKLSDELRGSLRMLKPEGHLLNDRYKSLQKRNIIEPRQKVKVLRRYKKKKFEKKSHKEITI